MLCLHQALPVVLVECIFLRYGSPCLEEIESFSRSLSQKMEEAAALGALPDDVALEVSERVVLSKQPVSNMEEAGSNCTDSLAASLTRSQWWGVQVSSPGAERVLRVPQDLERFHELPMYVRYVDEAATSSPERVSEQEEILELVEVGEAEVTWKIANVRFNREAGGKGRGLTKKQRERRLAIPIGALSMVRLYLDF